jgi:hypothetical protein
MTTGSQPSRRTTVNSRQWRPLRQTAQRRPARSITASSSGSKDFTILTIEDRQSGPLPPRSRPSPNTVAPAPGPQHAAATAFIDAGHPDVRAFSQRAVVGATTDRARISRVFTAVRDQSRYDPYQLSYVHRTNVASNVAQLHRESGPALRGCSDPSVTASTPTTARIRPGIGASDRLRDETVVGAPGPRTSATTCKQARIGAADYPSTPRPEVWARCLLRPLTGRLALGHETAASMLAAFLLSAST